MCIIIFYKNLEQKQIMMYRVDEKATLLCYNFIGFNFKEVIIMNENKANINWLITISAVSLENVYK